MIAKIRDLKKYSGFIRYFKNTSWMMAEQFLRILSGLFVGIWVARYLGPDEYGLLSYILAFTAIFAGIAKLGLDGILIRELIKNPEKCNSYLGSAFWLKIIGGITALILIAIILPFFSSHSQTNVYIFVVSLGLLFQSFDVVEFYFQSQVKSKIVSICKVIQLIFSSTIKICLVLNDAELMWFVFVTIADAISLAISYLIAFKIFANNSFYKSFSIGISKRLLRDSLPFIFTTLIVSIYMKIDQVMIMKMLGSKSVGYYSVAVTLSTAWYFFPTIICNSLFPALVNSRHENINLFYSRLQNLFTLMIWVSLLAALFVLLTSKYIINILYGEGYEPASSVLLIHIWGGVAVAFGIVWSKWILVENLQKYIVVFHLISMIINIIFNYLLIPIYGITGAALASAIACIIAQLTGVLFYKRKLAVKFLLNGFLPFYLLKKR